MPDDQQSGSLTFRVDARHIRQLGRELVGDRITAVSELIKNAYDADATRVTVAFSSEASHAPGGSLTISDNGSGMSLDDIRTRWMVISTDFKTTETASAVYARQRAGQKGIGRFSAESLGGTLVVSTTIRGQSERIIVTFLWNKYRSGQQIQDVSNSYRVEPCDAKSHGTTLEIYPLRHGWSEDDMSRVRDAVFLLQPPYDIATPSDGSIDPGFLVTVLSGTPDSRGDIPSVIDEVYEAATAWISADIREDGSARVSVDSDHLDISAERSLDGDFSLLGPCRFQAAYFIFRRDALNPGASVSVRQVQQLARHYGGVRVYRDKLRIMPYGAPRNDWLGLDALYRQRSRLLAPIGNTNFFGEVLLSRHDNPNIIDTASREGVIENAAFGMLTTLLRDALIWSVSLIASVRKKKAKDGREATEPERRTTIVEDIRQHVEAIGKAESTEEQTTALSDLQTVTERAYAEARSSDEQEEEVRQQLIDENALLRILASAGSLIAVFAHEVKAVLIQAEGAFGDIIDLEPGSLLSESIEEAETCVHALGDLTSYLNLYMSRTGRRRRRQLAVFEVVEGFVNQMAPLVGRRGISLEFVVDPPYIRTRPMARSELQAILFNLLSNAIRALDRENIRDRRIRVCASQIDGLVCISFHDTGVGIEVAEQNTIFDAFYTTSSADDAELGFGTGLGLTIVADIARANGGRAQVGTPLPGFSTNVEAMVGAAEATRGEGTASV